MKSPLHSTLHALFAAQLLKAGKPADGNWITAVLEALYELQRHQAMKVIRVYQRFLGLPNDATEPLKATSEDRGDDAP
jgi:hypothetical protein